MTKWCYFLTKQYHSFYCQKVTMITHQYIIFHYKNIWYILDIHTFRSSIWPFAYTKSHSIEQNWQKCGWWPVAMSRVGASQAMRLQWGKPINVNHFRFWNQLPQHFSFHQHVVPPTVASGVLLVMWWKMSLSSHFSLYSGSSRCQKHVL